VVKTKPSLKLESPLWRKNFLIFGLDEVGRGALAGPVVAAAVAFPPLTKTKDKVNLKKLAINDSKLLSSKRREELAKIIKKTALAWGIGRTTPGMIDRKGIVWATQKAMRQAVRKAENKLKHKGRQTFLLIDAFHVKYVCGVGLENQKPIKKGDQKSISIAAASIIAKVYRDELIIRLAKRSFCWARYGWEQNKGYGTKAHREAIKKYGLSRYHRRTFCRKVNSGRMK